jgi:flagellar hook-associated protein 2
MGISSLGVGSSILTQDVLDQLRKADEAQRITPITLNLANENDKKSSLEVLDASMTNFRDAINEMKSTTLYDQRAVTVSGTSVEMSAAGGSDVQEFTLDVTQLATKQIEESGSFGASTDTVATAAGSMNLNIDGQDFTINYDATTTLDDLKKSINDIAGDKVNASVVQVASGDYRMFLNSVDTGSTQDITITDTSGNLSGTQMTSDLTAIQTGVDAEFTYNGQAITRTSNNITDLVSGYDLTLKEVGSSTVKVEQNRDEIMSRVDSFVEKYNSIINELQKQTKSSTDSSERGIFSGESTIKSMEGAIRDMISTVSDAGGTMADYGFSIDRDGVMSVDKTTLNTKLDDNAANVEAFFAGGDFTNADGSTTAVNGAFKNFYDVVNGYTKVNGNLDLVKNNISETISSLEDRKTSETERLDDKYAILKKQYTAYDAVISKLNNSSALLSQLISSQSSSSSSSN